MNKKQHGGPGRGQGRHKEPGYSTLKRCRFLDATEEMIFGQTTPRERVELVLAGLRNQKSNQA